MGIFRQLPAGFGETRSGGLSNDMSRNTSIELSRLRTSYPAVSRFLTEEQRPPSPSNINELFPQSTSFGEDTILDNIHPRWKRNLFALLERPTSSPSAFLVYAMTTGLIIVSALITVLETVPAFHSISNRVWFGIETSLVALFTVEYISRCIAWSNTWTSLFKWIFCQSSPILPGTCAQHALLRNIFSILWDYRRTFGPAILH